MSGKAGPETKLIKHMRSDGHEAYGSSLVLTKYHGGAFGEDGVSDLLGTLLGIMIAIEVKAPESYRTRGEPDPDKALLWGPTTKQKAYLRRIHNAGGVAAVCVTREQFMVTLNAAYHYATTGKRIDLPWMDFIWDEDIICTCTVESGCEYATEGGCFYCRRAPVTAPCPNLDS